MTSKLSKHANIALRLAEGFAAEFLHSQYTVDHILCALCSEDSGLSRCFKDIGMDSANLKSWALTRIESYPKSQTHFTKSKPGESAIKVLEEATKICSRYGTNEINNLDLLEACLTPDVGYDQREIRRMPVALYEIIDWRQAVDIRSESNGVSNDSITSTLEQSGDGVLSKYCVSISALAEDGKIDPVLARDKELKQLLEILGKRISPNAMITGDPGVGKTSVLGGLALRIKEGTVPDSLKGAQILELDISGRLAAGAMRGEVEERMKAILEALKQSNSKTLLFIDEIHILLDEKGPVGSGLVNLLKPELSKGEITIIGATTKSEFQKYIEKDSAFRRRFSTLNIEEPNEASATSMLQGLAQRYEEFHKMGIQPEALPKAVSLAKKYVKDKHLPASAVELLDFTMACAVQMNATSKSVLEGIKAKLNSNEISEIEAWYSLKNNLSELLVGRFDDDDSPANVSQTIMKIEEWIQEEKTEVSETDIEAITAYISGIPMGKVRSGEGEKIQKAESLIKKRVVGQDHVVEAVVKSLKTFRANLKEPTEPGAIFFFTGPTGTGKTELAKAIAELLFDDENAMLRFDMSEFQESHSVATLLGAPPGYAGYEEGGVLVNNVRRNPYSVVLFDEIEKAHPDIYGIFLQMLTDGRLQDKQGKMADFSNTIIIFTSNAGAHEMVELFNQGKTPSGDELKEILRATRHFKDEFLGRVDSQILPFKPITEDVARMILNIHCDKLVKLLAKQHNVKLTIGEVVKDYLLKIGFSPVYGARPLKGAIKSFLTPPMAEKIIVGEISRGDKVSIGLNESEELTWEISSSKMELV